MKDCCGAYKLVIMDVNMPVLDGVEATRIINMKISTGEIPETKVVALSTGQLRTDQEHLFFEEVGFTAYICKPTGKVEFLNILRKYGIVSN
ncbi:MAG: response regulator [Candidatus Pacebacteria bacterium]|nr:response regulator [Candidatus Paceibacterota bacterium]